MTTLIFDWSDWEGPATGHVVVTRRTWRRAPESLHVPWQVVLPVDGRATLDVAHVAGEVVSIRWAPKGAASREDHVVVPDDGEHLAHTLERVDPDTLEPDAEPSPVWEAALNTRLDELADTIPTDVVTAADLAAALAALPKAGVSHIALDDDGTPAFSAGANDASLTTDTDGTPAVIIA